MFEEINRLVLGSAGLGGVWRKIDPQESIATILSALNEGITAIDTAPAYGDAELLIGQALRQWKGDRPIISSKVGRLKGFQADNARYCFTFDAMKKSVENSLKTLNISNIDILFLHDPAAVPRSDLAKVLEQMAFFRQQGYAKKIGLGGNAPEYFNPYLKSGLFDVMMEYNKLNACCMDALETTFLSGVEYYAASPLNMGLLGCNFSEFTVTPPDWLDKKNIVQAKRIKFLADKFGLSLQVFAHRFLITVPGNFKIVIGAVDRQELSDTLTAMRLGKLPLEIYNDILLTLNQQQHVRY